MADIDMSLDDIIKQDGNGSQRSTGGGGVRRGGRPAPTLSAMTRGGSTGVVRGGRPERGAARTQGTRSRSTPYARIQTGLSDGDHMNQADVRDVAASERPMLKVSSESKPNSVAGAICNIVRESPSGEPPSVMATGPAAINQAVKAIAIARKYLLEESPPVDMLVTPRFEQDLREGSNLVLELKRSETIEREPADNDLSAKERTEAHKLAGAIAGRARDGDEVAVTTKGAVPVLVAVKAVALAQEYLQEEGINVSFAVQFRDLEDPELRNTPSTFLHFAIVYSAAEAE